MGSATVMPKSACQGLFILGLREDNQLRKEKMPLGMKSAFTEAGWQAFNQVETHTF